jgi:cysteine synthase A
VPSVIDRMLKVPDTASFATLHFLQNILNQQFGASTGTNIYASFQLINERVKSKNNEEISIVSFICDDGTR